MGVCAAPGVDSFAVDFSAAARASAPVRATLCDEDGAFGRASADYAVADMPEGVLRRVGGEAGLALVCATGRVATALFLVCGGTSASTIVSGREEHTRFLEPRRARFRDFGRGWAGGAEARPD